MFCRQSCVGEGVWKHLLPSTLLPGSRQLAWAGRYPSRLAWCPQLRKRLRKELRLREDCFRGVPWPCCEYLPAWLGDRDGACLWRLSGDRNWSLCAMWASGMWLHLLGSSGKSMWTNKIELPLEGLFTFLSVVVTFLCSMTFEVCLRCSLFTLVYFILSRCWHLSVLIWLSMNHFV